MIKVTKFWFLREFDLFKKMNKKNLMEMCHLLEMINVKKDDVLYLRKINEKVVYFLKIGTIKIVRKESGHTQYILKKGNIFGELTLFENEEINESEEIAIVLEDSTLCIIKASQMEMLLNKFSSLKNQLIKLQGLKIRKLQRNLEDLIYKNSETRIREYVLNFINQFGQHKDGIFKAKNILSHQDIAHLTSTSRQTVSNVMGKLRREKLIDYNSKEIILIES